MEVKFGVPRQISPHRCNDKGVGPKKLNFLLRFDQNVKYKYPQGHMPCAIFTNFAEFVPHFRMCLVLKFCWIFSRGYEIMGVLS